MKRPQPDIGNILRDRYIMNLSTARKLRRLWGTTYVNNVEVLNLRQYYWKEADRSENFEKLFKFLGAYENVTETDYDGVRNAWMYFNKNNADNVLLDPNGFVADNLNIMWWDPEDGPQPENLTLTTSIVISTAGVDKDDIDRLNELLDPEMEKETLIANIENNYNEIWNMCKISQEGVGVINKGSIEDSVNKILVPDEDDLTPDDPWMATLARYALRSTGVECTIKDLSIGVDKPFGNKFNSAQLYYTTFIVEIEIPYSGVYTAGNGIVQTIGSDIVYNYNKKSTDNGYTTQKMIKAMDSTDLEDDEDLVTRSYILWEDIAEQSEAVFNSIWYEYENKWYLRADAFSDPRGYGLTYSELVNYVLPLLDSGYKKKKVPWYKKAIAVILVVVAFIAAYVAPGPGAKLGAQLLAVAKAVVAASLVLTIAILAFAIIGMEEWASAFGEVSKTIEPLVRIAQIITLVDGLNRAFEKTAKEVAKEKSVELGTEVAASEVATSEVISAIIDSSVSSGVDSLVDSLVEGFTDVVAGNITTNAAIAFSGKMIQLVDFGYKLKLKSLVDKNKDLQAEYEDLQKELAQESDALRGFSLIYSKPATADWSIYSSQFDMPYERGGGQLAMGNIQRTTKHALRKAKYDDPAFAGILII
jgi:hypothetical protein